MTVAPKDFAICSAKTDTPPVPSNSTFESGPIAPPQCSAVQAVTPAQARQAAVSVVIPSGTGSSADSGNTPNSVSAPGASLPVERVRTPARTGCDSQSCQNTVMTRSPGLNCDTSLPTDSTSPAPSESGMSGYALSPP